MPIAIKLNPEFIEKMKLLGLTCMRLYKSNNQKETRMLYSEHILNKNGGLLQSIHYNTYSDNCELTNYSHYTYYSSGQLLNELHVDVTAHSIMEDYYKYDDAGNVCKKVTSGLGQNASYQYYTYNLKKQLTEYKKLNEDDSILEHNIYTYSESNKNYTILNNLSGGKKTYITESIGEGEEKTYIENDFSDAYQIIRFNKKGQKENISKHIKQGLVEEIRFAYNDEGKLIQKELFDYSPPVNVDFIKFIRDEEKRQKTIRYFSEMGIRKIEYIDYETDKSVKHQKVIKDPIQWDGYVETFDYDKYGNNTEYKKCNHREEVRFWNKFEYNEQGLLVKNTTLDEDGAVREWIDYEYL